MSDRLEIVSKEVYCHPNTYVLSNLKKIKKGVRATALTVAICSAVVLTNDVETLQVVAEIPSYSEPVLVGAIAKRQNCDTETIHITSQAKNFMDDHQAESNIYKDVIEKIPEYFPNIKEIVVDTVCDEYDIETLAVDILIAESIEQAIKKLDAFDEGWWLDYQAEGKSNVCVDVVSV